MKTTSYYSSLPYRIEIRGGRVQGCSTATPTSARLSTMKRRKRKKNLDLGPSQVAVNAFKGKGGVHDDQKINHKKARKQAKRVAKEYHAD